MGDNMDSSLGLHQLLRSLQAVAHRRTVDVVMAKTKKSKKKTVLMKEDFEELKKGTVVELKNGYASMLLSGGKASDDQSEIDHYLKNKEALDAAAAAEAAEKAAIAQAEAEKRIAATAAADAKEAAGKAAADAETAKLEGDRNILQKAAAEAFLPVAAKKNKIEGDISAFEVARALKKVGVVVDENAITVPQTKGLSLTEGALEIKVGIALTPEDTIDIPIELVGNEDDF
jgi:ribosomal protein L9